MKQTLLTLSLLALGGLAFPTGAGAQSALKVLGSFDAPENGGNGDGQLTLSEARNWERRVRAGAPTDEDIADLNDVISEIEQFGTRPVPQTGAAEKPEFQRFYLQQGTPSYEYAAVPDKKTGDVRVIGAKRNPAVLSFTTNREKDTEVGAVAVGFAYLLGAETQTKLTSLRDPATFLWADFEGTFNGAKGNETNLQAGYKLDWINFAEGRPFAYHASVTPYIGTDMHFNASLYGLDLTLSPSYPPYLFRTLSGTGLSATFGINALAVDKGGETSLKDGTEHLWVSSDLSYTYKVPLNWKAPPEFTAAYKVGHDLLSGDTEDLVSLGLSWPLDDENKTRLSLTHTFGRDIPKLKAKDETMIKLELLN